MAMTATSLPTGTVTFLFTDIEGSTRRWEAHPQQMQTALQQHDAILRKAIEGNEGHVFKTLGDAFYAAFPTPLSALAAALNVQRFLPAEQRDEVIGAMLVRMALHTGMVEARDSDYFGQPLNRAARLLAAGHGGQVLLSEVTYGLVRDSLPNGVGAVDLGQHRLKDLIRPEHIFQLLAPALPSRFPPLRTLDSHPNNLPLQPTPFIGRDKEVAEVCALLRRSDVRLVTLTGPGGTGKTRLALQVGADLLDDYADGVFSVELAALSDPALVAPTIAQTLGVMESPGKPVIDSLKDYLASKDMLLVLDNFEQVASAAPVVDALMKGVPHLTMLVTSRTNLNLYGEHDYAVPPLALPNPIHLPPLERLTQYEAVRLFIERAQAVKADFQVINDNAPAVAEICVRLDGLPLAIELAAARVRLFPPQALLSRLSSRLNLLTGGASNLPSRHQTLRRAIGWSYDLLTEGEKQLFRRMAVFQGGRALEALEAVCNFDGQRQVEVLDGVESLVNKSLLQEREGRSGGSGGRRGDGEPRFWMLETIHEYAREKLLESGEVEELSRAHAAYFLAFAKEAVPHLPRGDARLWVDRLEDEHDNFRRAVSWAIERARLDRDGGQAQAGRNGEAGEADETALRLVAVLESFWRQRGYFFEGRSQIEAALAVTSRSTLSSSTSSSSSSSPRQRTLAKARAGALTALSFICFPMEDYVAGRAAAEEALAISRELGDARSIGLTLFNLGATVRELGDYDGARALLEESVAVLRQLGEDSWAGEPLVNLAEASADMGDLDEAKRLLEEALQLYRKAKSPRAIAFAHLVLGQVAIKARDYASARSYLEAALSGYRQVGSKYREFSCLEGLVDLELIVGNCAAAGSVLAQALALAGDMGLDKSVANLHFKEGLLALEQGQAVQAGRVIHGTFQRLLSERASALDAADIAYWLGGFAWAASATGDMVRAARLLGVADRLQKAWGVPSKPLGRMVYERALQAVRSQLSEEEFQEACEQGAAMSKEQAIEYALEGGAGD